MDLTAAIDAYCERVSPAFWAEPLNAVTNLAFVVAALAVLLAEGARSGSTGRQIGAALLCLGAIGCFLALTLLLIQVLGRGASAALAWPIYGLGVAFLAAGALALPSRWWVIGPLPNWPLAWLAGNALAVGIGSFFFHTYAMRWAGIADTLPIGIFILSYFAVAMNRFAGLSWRASGWATLGFLFALVLLGIALGRFVGGPAVYLSALLGLLAVGLWLHVARAHPAGRWLIAGAAVFAVSLTARSLDQPMCPSIPSGTHFLWHVLNGLLFWVLLSAVVRFGRAAAPAAPAGAAP